MMTAAFADMFRVRWELSLPGQITDSNADQVDGGKAIWVRNLTDMRETREFYATSEAATTSAACSRAAS